MVPTRPRRAVLRNGDDVAAEATVKFIYQYPDTTGADVDMLDSGSLADVARGLDDSG